MPDNVDMVDKIIADLKNVGNAETACTARGLGVPNRFLWNLNGKIDC